jgi:hypothetical protein
MLLFAVSSSLSSSQSRRAFLASSSSFAVAVQPAHALKERNEALCNTGFFTNIWEYRCTEIGDISDEAAAREMTSKEQGAVDSLMSKLDLTGDRTNTKPPTRQEQAFQTNMTFNLTMQD